MDGTQLLNDPNGLDLVTPESILSNEVAAFISSLQTSDPTTTQESQTAMNLQNLEGNMMYLNNDMLPTNFPGSSDFVIIQTLQDPKIEADEMAGVPSPEIETSVEKMYLPKHGFTVKVSDKGRDDSYVYSTQLNRMYTSLAKPCTFDLSFNSDPTAEWIVRVMLVCSNQLYYPLSRCHHHQQGDNSTLREHLMVRRDAAAEYVGTAAGKSFLDRLALKVPMGTSDRKSITLEFMCLSSCHKIRKIQTALVFTLEDQNSGHIVGREVINIQISKNFKRDMDTAEKGAAKPGQKRKQDLDSVAQPEPGTSNFVQVQQQASAIELNLNIPMNAAPDFLKYAQQFFQAKLYGAGQGEEQDLMPCLNKIRLLASKIESENTQGDGC